MKSNHGKRRTLAGFTLIEITVVLVVTMVLAAFAVPKYNYILERFRAQEGKDILLTLLGAQKRYSLHHNDNYATSLGELDIDVRDSLYFNTPSVNNSQWVASIQRTGIYTLSIHETGRFCCNPIGAENPVCTKIGCEVE